MKKLKRRLSEGFLRLSVSPSPKEPSPGPHGSSPSTSRSLERPIANKQRSQRPKSLVSLYTLVLYLLFVYSFKTLKHLRLIAYE